ncbi:hypothetical protein [Xenorhabdus szentirmaii]|uniref:Uncharacterized protein n=1 Tax=Xenorhabdus szentirmaii TaxID=290112 RepID=A0AAW3YX15_9GAMM|nr:MULTISPECIES: hypothetical protein [Xenorhabdus]MBD2793677.1 hypothetical protein [Xenorhabdus sp. CUL]MBD2802091.1 hypothetical protein [Xenorhabdus sp. M]MBD2806474.1 hypothetical protein [Xenorhabdus sp. ZM]MBD2819958.1 hypothetical protein [Xenorhabdus sp. 42]MBD2826549.1 hypothetical protein [Xenorhabdus sp. 5]
MTDNKMSFIGSVVGSVSFLFCCMSSGSGVAPIKKMERVRAISNNMSIERVYPCFITSGISGVVKQHNKFYPNLNLIGCLTLCLLLHNPQNIIVSTQYATVVFGIAFKVFMN